MAGRCYYGERLEMPSLGMLTGRFHTSRGFLKEPIDSTHAQSTSDLTG